MKIGPLSFNALDLLLIAAPVAFGLELAHASPGWIFALSCLAIIPLAKWMGTATEHLASHFGAGIGGLLNATFGNAAEMIIAIFALSKGLHEIVRASLTGSIIGNVLLVLGLSILLGGFKHQRQQFNRTAAGLGSTLLALSAIGLSVPALLHWVAGPELGVSEHHLSLALAIVLFLTYLLSLVFSLKTHRHLFAGSGHHSLDVVWSRKLAAIVLVVATTLVAFMSELLVGSVEHTAETWGLTPIFVGVIVVAIIGNAAEHSTAVLMAMKNKMDLSVNIAVGSGIQIALLIAPVLVFLSYAFGQPFDLIFTPFEVVSIAVAVSVVSLIAHDGESHWMEGVLLLAVYVIMGMAFFSLPG